MKEAKRVQKLEIRLMLDGTPVKSKHHGKRMLLIGIAPNIFSRSQDLGLCPTSLPVCHMGKQGELEFGWKGRVWRFNSWKWCFIHLQWCAKSPAQLLLLCALPPWWGLEGWRSYFLSLQFNLVSLGKGDIAGCLFCSPGEVRLRAGITHFPLGKTWGSV